MTPFAPLLDGRPLDLSDGTVLEYGTANGTLRVRVRLWDESECEIVFEQVVGVWECLAGDLDAIVFSEEPQGAFAIAASCEVSGRPGRPAKVKQYRFLDPGGRASFEVITEAGGTVSAQR